MSPIPAQQDVGDAGHVEAVLRAVLKTCFIEAEVSDGKTDNAVLIAVHQLLHSSFPKAFQEIPLSVDFIYDRNSSGKITSPTTPEINLLPFKGILLDDSLHAAAGGRDRAVYKAKGMRSYWCDDMILRTYSLFCEITYEGLSYHLEPTGFELPLILDLLPEQVSEYFRLLQPKKARFFHEMIVEFLCTINEPFDHPFAIEHVLTPPDVLKASGFSQNVRNTLWKVVTTDVVAAREKGSSLSEFIKYALSLLGRVDVPPPAEHLIRLVTSLLRESQGISSPDVLLKVMEDIRDRVLPQQAARLESLVVEMRPDILELKPGLMGVSLNLKEVWKRVLNVAND